MDYIEFGAYKVFKFITRFLPLFFMKWLLDSFSFIAFVIDKKHKKIALQNLDLAFGETLSGERKTQIIKNSYKNIFYGLYELVVNQSLDFKQLEKKVTNIIGEEYMLEALKTGKPIILVSAHYGYWELLSSYFSLKYRPITVVGRPLNNDLLNDDLRIARNQHNSIMLDKKGAAKGLVKAIKDGRLIGLVVDQHASYEAGGIMIKFFGKDATQTDSPARLALRYDGIIIPVFVLQKELGKYEVKYYPAIDKNSGDINIMTQLQADVIEQQIKEYPDIWLWQHKRWKSDAYNIYN